MKSLTPLFESALRKYVSSLNENSPMSISGEDLGKFSDAVETTHHKKTVGGEPAGHWAMITKLSSTELKDKFLKGFFEELFPENDGTYNSVIDNEPQFKEAIVKFVAKFFKKSETHTHSNFLSNRLLSILLGRSEYSSQALVKFESGGVETKGSAEETQAEVKAALNKALDEFEREETNASVRDRQNSQTEDAEYTLQDLPGLVRKAFDRIDDERRDVVEQAYDFLSGHDSDLANEAASSSTYIDLLSSEFPEEDADELYNELVKAKLLIPHTRRDSSQDHRPDKFDVKDDYEGYNLRDRTIKSL